MARLQGISGGMSGKTGSFTFRQSGGQTIVSQYQPIVKNPNTKGQQDQRAKFKLMSQLAAIMAPAFGSIGINERPARGRMSQRNAFVALNFPLASINADNTMATLPMEQLKLTSSTRPLGTLNGSLNGGNLNVSVSAIPSGVQALRIVVIGYRKDGIANGVPSLGITRPEIVAMSQAPVTGSSASSIVSNITAEKVTVLIYGLIPTTSGAGRLNLTEIHTPEDEDFISAVDLEMMVSSGAMAVTQTLGLNVSTADSDFGA